MVLVTIRYFQQRIVLRPLPASYILGNITISLASVMVLIWSVISALERMKYLAWCKDPADSPLDNPDEQMATMKVCVPGSLERDGY